MSAFKVSPSTATAGQTTLLTFTGTGTAWTSATLFTASAGTLSSIEVDAATQTATALFAAPGTAQDVTFADSAGAESTNQVAVSAGSFIVSPASATVGQSRSITLTGSGTLWTASTTFTPSAGTLSGVTINVGAQTATATFVAPATAQTVTISDSNGASSNAFAVTAGTFSVSPGSVAIESSTSISFAGSGTSWTSATQFIPSLGAVSNVVVNVAAQTATATYTSPATAQVVSFTDSNAAASTNTLTVSAGTFSVSPATSSPNQSQSVTLTGSGTRWTASTVFTPSAGTLSAVAVNVGAQTATGTFVAPNTPGTSITFSDDNGAQSSSAIAIPATGAAGSFLVSPTTADPGDTVTVTFTGNGTTWDNESLFASSADVFPPGTTGLYGVTVSSGTVATGTFTAPATAQTVTFTVQKNGGAGANGSAYNALVVGTPAAPTSTPTISSAATASGTVGASFSYQITASPTPNNYAASGLPPGLSLNARSGLITGRPAQAGTSSVSLVATNASGGGAAFALTLTVGESYKPNVPTTFPAILTAFSGTAGPAPTGFLNGALPGAPAGVPPLFSGSINSSMAVRLPGAPLSINDFGLDVYEGLWRCRTAVAATLKPDLYDAHPSLPNMYCTDSVSTEDEGLTSTIRATYKGLVKGTPRPAKRSMSCDTDNQTLSFANGVDGASVSGAGGTTTQGTISIQVSVPQPVYNLRGATTTQPDMTQLGAYFTAPPGVPAIPPTFIFPAYSRAGLQAPWILIATLVFAPYAKGWFCDRLEWTQEGLYYQVTQQWRLSYEIIDYIYPTAADNAAAVGSFSVSPTSMTAGTTVNVTFVGTGTKWTSTTFFGSTGGVLAGVTVSGQTASGTYTAPDTDGTTMFVDNNGASSTNGITVIG